MFVLVTRCFLFQALIVYGISQSLEAIHDQISQSPSS